MEPKRWSAIPAHLVPSRLAELGVSEAMIAQALDAGQHSSAGCTGHHPVNYPGILAWGEAVAELRDQLVPLGWAARDTRGFPTVVHPTAKHQIAIAGGTADTGRANAIPKTRRPKGIVTELVVADNLISLDPTGAVFGVVYSEPVAQTWFVLHYADPIADEVRIELSLPEEMHNGQIVRWKERLILAPLAGTRDVPIVANEPDDDIDIDITRRA